MRIAHKGAGSKREVKGEGESETVAERQGGTNGDVEGRENREADYPCELRPAAVAKPVLRLHSLFIRRVVRARGGSLMKGVY